MSTFLSDSLAAIIDQAYKIFQMHPPESAGVCTECCMLKKDEAQILTTPVRSVPKELIEEWLNAAFDLHPTEASSMWLLPRLMDLVAQNIELNTVGDEIIFKRCGNYSPVSVWTTTPKACFEKFAVELFAARLRLPNPRIDETLCMFSNAGMGMNPLLNYLEQLDIQLLAQAIIAESETWFTLGGGAFWENGVHRREVQDWASRSKISDRLLDAAIVAKGQEQIALFHAAETTSSA